LDLAGKVFNISDAKPVVQSTEGSFSN